MTLLYPSDDFEAFLTAVLETWIHRSPEWEIVAETSGWFPPSGPCRRVERDPASAQRMATGIRTQAGDEAWSALGQAFRHAGAGKEALLARFVRACVRYQRSTLEHLTDSDVGETLHRARAVRAEAHRYVGLLRFQAVEGGWYAGFEPDHDVLGMLVGTFHHRMAGLDWALHDHGRRKAWVHEGGQGRAVVGIVAESGVRQGSEVDAQSLWKTYFRTIAITERINPRLQRSKMPQKTWKHLVEKG